MLHGIIIVIIIWLEIMIEYNYAMMMHLLVWRMWQYSSKIAQMS